LENVIDGYTIDWAKHEQEFFLEARFFHHVEHFWILQFELINPKSGD
jgi:hypothetical protein